MADLTIEHAGTSLSTRGSAYSGEALRHVAMPLGGLGAGQIALGGDGGLRQWQMVNQVNHLGFVPDSFFAIRTACIEPPVNITRVLLSREVQAFAENHTPLVNDDVIPPDQRSLLQRYTGVEKTRFSGSYPFAHITYEDAQLPLDVELEAYSPFIPLDAQASGLPAIIFTFTLRNRGSHSLQGGLGATLQNAVGWDGITPTSGNRNPLYGGNVNRLREHQGMTSLLMENPTLPDDHPGQGQMTLSTLSPSARAYERWTAPEHFMRSLEGLNPDSHLKEQSTNAQRSYRNGPQVASGPSPAGETWNGGLVVPFWLAPGATQTIMFILSWYFPNRYVNFDQFGPRRNYGRSRFWLGNAYTTRFADALEVTKYIIANQPWLEQTSRAWARGLADSTLPAWLNEALAAQGSLMRSPTCFWTEDGKFYGFEGSLGASTAMWSGDFGGSCPLNCTHVWNYEQALSRLFPQLERTMRETDLKQTQAPAGYIPHRTLLPSYLPQLWDVPVGGPHNPALDGMLGTVLKVYREVRQGAGQAWLDEHWPHITRLMSYIIAHWDANEDGVLEGEQPNTYDIAFYGPNMYIGGLWLAALRAAEELANLQHATEQAMRYRRLFEHGRQKYDELLWNGEYYIQLIDPTIPPQDQFGDGCLADQLFGQWWAHLLDLGHILPEQHVKQTLRSIVNYNFHSGFHDFTHGYRVFADKDDAGLLVCTWPRGGRPEVPVRYCDEVWTGIEYQVGAHCIIEGMVEEGLKILAALRARYSGNRRNPYNEIECGDHYSRAMAGWSVLDALSGFRYNALADALTFAPAGEPQDILRVPFITRDGWGTFAKHKAARGWQIDLTCTFGQIQIQRLNLAGDAAVITASKGGMALAFDLHYQDNLSTLAFTETLTLPAGTTLAISLAI
ncbi:MAG TPA: GH116 family glycosyl-hydrolase [Ktedonobacteraceae bacterium]